MSDTLLVPHPYSLMEEDVPVVHALREHAQQEYGASYVKDEEKQILLQAADYIDYLETIRDTAEQLTSMESVWLS